MTKAERVRMTCRKLLIMTETIIHSASMVVLSSRISSAMLSDSRASTWPLQLLTSSSGLLTWSFNIQRLLLGDWRYISSAAEMRWQRKTLILLRSPCSEESRGVPCTFSMLQEWGDRRYKAFGGRECCVVVVGDASKGKKFEWWE